MLYEFLLEKDKQLAYSLGKNIMKTNIILMNLLKTDQNNYICKNNEFNYETKNCFP